MFLPSNFKLIFALAGFILFEGGVENRGLAWAQVNQPSPELQAPVHPVDPRPRTITGQAGRDIRIGVFASLRADCTAGALPSIRLLDQPKHGKVNVQQGKIRATNHKNCLAAEVPAFVIFYRSNPNFEGQDHVSFEVVSGGKRQSHKITVIVTGSKGTQRI
jgi:hypothetical protein